MSAGKWFRNVAGGDSSSQGQSAPDQINAMRLALGNQLYQQINLYHKLLKSKQCTGNIRLEAEEAYKFMLKVAKQDIANLQRIQLLIITLKGPFRHHLKGTTLASA